ncbi:MAG: YqaE/Pmp3 family membrane protein [Roseiarcus sp.]
MRYLLALFLPWLAFFTIGMVGSGVICLILQLTVIGWLPAAIWAFFAINNYYAAERDEALRRELRSGSTPDR